MPVETRVVPYKKEVDGATGHTVWYVRVETVDENGNVMHGAHLIEGIEFEALNIDHGGSHEAFLKNVVKPKALKLHAALNASHAEADGLVGKPIG